MGTDASVITIWHDKEDAVAQVLQKQLDQLAPEITVKLERKSDLTEALKMVGNDPKAAPDRYFFAHDKIGVYAEMGILSPIADFIPRKELDQYMDMTLQAATYQEQIYQLPVYYETLLFMYNKRYMKETQVPATTEELYAYMQENTRGGHYGFVEQHSTAYYLSLIHISTMTYRSFIREVRGKLLTIWTGAFQSIPIPTTWAENSRISAAFFWDLRRCFCWRSFSSGIRKGIPGSCCTQSR